MRARTRAFGMIAGLGALALAAACGGSSKPTTPSSSGTSGAVAGFQALNPGSGTPQKGGTLNMLGVGDVDYLDYNISYYSTGYIALRFFVRGLYAYPAIPGHTTDPYPDLATAAPSVSSDGLTYTITIRNGAMWNSTPARQVTAADAVLGLKRSCNPAQPFGGLPDFQALIVGFATFCDGFKSVKPDVADIKAYIDSHQIAGATASGQTLTYKLVHPASYFAAMLTLSPFNPAPIESLNYVPASNASYQHTLSDGPYMVKSYVPARSFVFVRNPAWQASSDPIRKAYVDQINVSMTGDQATIQQQLQTNTAAASMEWDTFPPPAAVPGLVQQMNSGGQNFNLGDTFSTNPYVIFNTVSPNNGGALGKAAVRQAISYAINRTHLIQDANGPEVSPPLNHILPPGTNGSQSVSDSYPYDVNKAKQALSAAGFPNGMTMKFLYRPKSALSSSMFQTLQADLGQAGIKLVGVGVPQADFYTKYLQVPSVAHKGTWDISLAGWGPDWYGDAAVSFFTPLFYGPASYPPTGSNFGFYNNPQVISLTNQASRAASTSAAATLWAQADKLVMQDAPIYPITAPRQPLYHASYVHNAVYIASLQQFDPMNVWLSTP